MLALLNVSSAVGAAIVIGAFGIAVYVARHRTRRRTPCDWLRGAELPFRPTQSAAITDNAELRIRCWSCKRVSFVAAESLPVGAVVTFVCADCSRAHAARARVCNG